MSKGCQSLTPSSLFRWPTARGLAGLAFQLRLQLVGMRLVVGCPSGVHGLGSRGAQFLGREGGCAGLTTETRQIRDVNDDPICHCLEVCAFLRAAASIYLTSTCNCTYTETEVQNAV